MKKAITILFWFLSVFLALMALALLSGSVLTGAMLLGCAIVIHPVFLQKVPLKKGTTALLAIGLFIGAIAVFPSAGAPTTEQSQVIPQARQAAQSKEDVLQTPLREVSLADRTITETNAPTIPASATPKITVTPKITATPTITATPKITAPPTPRPTMTQKPTEQPTDTPKLTPVPLTRSVGITIIEYTDTVRRGAYASIQIQGVPNTDYTCEVEYKTTMSNADGLGKKRSDANGNVSWRWKVGPRTSLDYMPTIYIDGGGDSISVEFDVTE